jgi:hypothetical protein
MSSLIKFWLLLSFPNIWTVPHSQMIWLLSLSHDFALHLCDEIATYYLVFSTFISRTTSLLISITVCVSLYSIFVISQ